MDGIIITCCFIGLYKLFGFETTLILLLSWIACMLLNNGDSHD